MTNEEKAKEIMNKFYGNFMPYYTHNEVFDKCFRARYADILEAMQWKDEQFAKEKEKVIEDACEKIMQQAKDDYKFIKKEKQQWIERACKYIKKNVCEHINHNPLYKDYKHEEKIGFQLVVDEHFYIDFKKTMEEL